MPKKPSPVPLIIIAFVIAALGVFVLVFDHWRDSVPSSDAPITSASHA